MQGDVNTAQQWTEPATLQALLHLLRLMLKNLAQLDIIIKQVDNIPLFIRIQLHDLIHTALKLCNALALLRRKLFIKQLCCLDFQTFRDMVKCLNCRIAFAVAFQSADTC